MTDETIFATALEKADPAERAAFLAEVCGDDTARRQRLEGLLLAHARVADFLERSPVAAADPDNGATQAVTGTREPAGAVSQTTAGDDGPADDEARRRSTAATERRRWGRPGPGPTGSG